MNHGEEGEVHKSDRQWRLVETVTSLVRLIRRTFETRFAIVLTKRFDAEVQCGNVDLSMADDEKIQSGAGVARRPQAGVKPENGVTAQAGGDLVLCCDLLRSVRRSYGKIH